MECSKSSLSKVGISACGGERVCVSAHMCCLSLHPTNHNAVPYVLEGILAKSKESGEKEPWTSPLLSWCQTAPFSRGSDNCAQEHAVEVPDNTLRDLGLSLFCR